MAGVCAPVAVITTTEPEGPYGATVSSLASLSLRPALISIALDRGSSLLTHILSSRRFGVNILCSGQDEMAMLFAKRGADRFGCCDWSTVDGLPRLDGVAGWAACELHQQVEAGDHLLLIGEVTRAVSSPRAPLIYGHRIFGTHSRFQHRPRRPITDHIAACTH